MLNAAKVLGRAAPHHADDAVPLLQEKLGQVTTILPGDAGNQGCLHALGLHYSVLLASRPNIGVGRGYFGGGTPAPRLTSWSPTWDQACRWPCVTWRPAPLPFTS